MANYLMRRDFTAQHAARVRRERRATANLRFANWRIANAIPGLILLKAAQRGERSARAETQPHHRDIRRGCGK